MTNYQTWLVTVSQLLLFGGGWVAAALYYRSRIAKLKEKAVLLDVALSLLLPDNPTGEELEEDFKSQCPHFGGVTGQEARKGFSRFAKDEKVNAIILTFPTNRTKK